MSATHCPLIRLSWSTMTTTTALASDADDLAWLSTKEAAEVLGLDVRQLYRLIDHGDLPAYKFGRVIRLRRREVLAFRARESGDSLRD